MSDSENLKTLPVIGYCGTCGLEYVYINWDNPDRACWQCGTVGFGVPTDQTPAQVRAEPEREPR